MLFKNRGKRQSARFALVDLALSCSTLLFHKSVALSFQIHSSQRSITGIQENPLKLNWSLHEIRRRGSRNDPILYRTSETILSRLREKGSQDMAEDEILTQPAVVPSDWTWIATLVFPLWLVYISNQWSRYSISYLVDFSSDETVNSFTAMNVDLGFNQVQYGVLASVAFTCLYAIASLFAGVASDKFDRKLLTVVSCVAWSIATLGTALSSSYSIVIIWRIAMGLACAFATPTAYTLIQQNVPPNRVALGSSLYGTGVALGSGLSSLSIILDSAIGWRQTEVLIAAVGLASAALCIVLLPNDPKRDMIKDADIDELSKHDEYGQKRLAPSFSSTIGDVEKIFAIPRVRWLYLASFLRFCSGISIGVWGAPYFRMAFPDSQQQYSVAQAAISAIGATTSGILGGVIADRLSNPNHVSGSDSMDDDPVGRRLLVPVLGSLLAAPTWYFAVQTGVGSEKSFEVAMVWLAIEYLVAECWFGPTISSLQSTVGPKVGGVAQGLFSLTGAAANTAPALLGYLYGQAVTEPSSSTSSDELSSLLVAGVCFGYLSSAFCFGMASRAGQPGNEAKND